jgi:hypothetical protein
VNALPPLTHIPPLQVDYEPAACWVNFEPFREAAEYEPVPAVFDYLAA